MSHDPQKNKVYLWERAFIAPKDASSVSLANCQPIVDHVWHSLGKNHPPKITKLSNLDKSSWAKASRMKIYVRESVPTWVLLHEIAHSLSSDFDGRSDRHGKFYVRHYVDLLTKFLNCDEQELHNSIARYGIEIYQGTF